MTNKKRLITLKSKDGKLLEIILLQKRRVIHNPFQAYALFL